MGHHIEFRRGIPWQGKSRGTSRANRKEQKLVALFGGVCLTTAASCDGKGRVIGQVLEGRHADCYLCMLRRKDVSLLELLNSISFQARFARSTLLQKKQKGAKWMQPCSICWFTAERSKGDDKVVDTQGFSSSLCEILDGS